jgi:hypothetical protein
MKINRTVASAFCILAGLCDGSTGIMLVLAPVFTLKLMGIAAIPAEPVYMQFIGAFVASVGFSYLFPFIAFRGERRDPALHGMLVTTTIIRLFIGTFTSVAIARGTLSSSWLTVPLSDFTIAAVQLFILKQKVFATHA